MYRQVSLSLEISEPDAGFLAGTVSFPEIICQLIEVPRMTIAQTMRNPPPSTARHWPVM